MPELMIGTADNDSMMVKTYHQLYGLWCRIRKEEIKV
jgi:hypothetical protein